VKKRKWINIITDLKKKISRLEPTARLSYISCISSCIIAIVFSLNGWCAWLTAPEIMEQFTEKELDELWKEMRKLAIEFLKNDEKWTKKKQFKSEKLCYIG